MHNVILDTASVDRWEFKHEESGAVSLVQPLLETGFQSQFAARPERVVGEFREAGCFPPEQRHDLQHLGRGKPGHPTVDDWVVDGSADAAVTGCTTARPSGSEKPAVGQYARRQLPFPQVHGLVHCHDFIDLQGIRLNTCKCSLTSIVCKRTIKAYTLERVGWQKQPLLPSHKGMSTGTPENPHEAAAAAMGYLFQCRYALLEGLRAVP